MRSGMMAVALGLMAGSLGAFELGSADTTVYAAKDCRQEAQELSEYLSKVFGKKFAVKEAPSKVAAEDVGFFVGVRPEGYAATWDEARDCSVRIVERDRVWLFGNDALKLKGTANAVYDFLEKYAGVRWLWPGEVGTVADPQAPVTLADETFVYVPPFERRLTSSFSGVRGLSKDEHRDLIAWLRHRHVGGSLMSRSSGFQHAFGSLMPRAEYGAQHPEYYSLVSPERWIGEPKPLKSTRLSDPLMPGPWQICTSNPEVRQLVAQKLIDRKTTELQSISPNDGYGFCECPACKAQDPSGKGISATSYDVTDRMYDYLQDVAWRVYKASPTSKVGLFSYSFYAGVPERKVNLPPNVYLSCCYLTYRMNRQQEAELAEKLTALSQMGAKIVGREYWGCHYTMRYPLSHSRKIDRNLKLLHRLGAAGIYGETGNSFGPRASDLYLLTMLAWDPMRDRAAALKDFCEKGFGPKAGPVMYDLFEFIEDCVEKQVETLDQNHGPTFQFYSNVYADFNRFMSTVFNKDFSAACDKALKKATVLADTPERKARVAYIGMGLEFARRTTESLEALADLAAAGMDVPLTQPSGKEVRMEKAALLKVADRAIDAEVARRTYPTLCRQSNVLTPDFRSEALSLRPWKVMAERAKLLLKSDRYNYLVNGAFEYSGYSWDVTGGGEVAYSTARNHDADDNVMVQCHHKQGISLQLDVAPGGEMTVRNRRPVSPAKAVAASFKLFVRCEQDPLPLISATFGGVKLEGVDVSKEIPDADHWHEIRFRPVDLPAGDHVFELAVKNPGTAPLTFNFDGLDLRLGKRE